jgi:hypothetical protein
MTLRDVCHAVAPHVGQGFPVLTAQDCKGPFHTMGIARDGAGFSMYRLKGVDETETPLTSHEQVDSALQELQAQCSVFRVGAGYYNVRLRIDASSRLTDLSAVMIDGNDTSGW